MDDPRRYLGLHTVAMLRKIIRKWWQVDVGFADATGQLADESWGEVPAAGNDFCRAMLSTNKGRRRCLKSVKEIHRQLRKKSKISDSMVHNCHLGLGMVACPVHLGGQYLGFVFACGYSNREISRTRTIRLTGVINEISADKAALAGERVPVLSREDVERMKDLLVYGSREMAAFEEEIVRRKASEDSTKNIVFEDVFANSLAMNNCLKQLRKKAHLASPILLVGERGTGKRLLAKSVHLSSRRRQEPFFKSEDNSDEHTSETRIFGQLRGSSLGKIGLLEAARGGTVYLHFSSWQQSSIQVKLLRLLQEGTIVPLGSNQPIELDVRIILGIDTDLDSQVAAGHLRRDLADCLNEHSLQVPPLRERKEDIIRLINLFIHRHLTGDKNPPDIHPDSMALLTRYHWPGNANELEEEVRSFLSICNDGRISPEHLSARIRQAAGQGPRALDKALENEQDLKSAMAILERELIHEGLIRTQWNKSLLARQLGISRSNLLAKISKYDLDKLGHQESQKH
jgi:DNA-binding NtrC family response regulator